jgi:hypothetical protein
MPQTNAQWILGEPTLQLIELFKENEDCSAGAQMPRIGCHYSAGADGYVDFAYSIVAMTFGSTFASLWASWHWRPIRNCRGRYCLVTSNSRLPVSALIPDTPATIYCVRAARDPVLVVELEGGGLISYLRKDGTLMHTLNTSEGFRRKLSQLGIAPEAGATASWTTSKIIDHMNMDMCRDGRNNRYR